MINFEGDSTLAAYERSPYAYAEAGLNACTVDDPVFCGTALGPTTGVPLYTKCNVTRETNFGTIRYIISQVGGAELANGFIAVYNAAGTRLGTSANQETTFKGTTGEKSVTITPDSEKSLVIAPTKEAYVWIMLLTGTQAASPLQLRAANGSGPIANFALAALGKVLRCGTEGSGKTAAPASFTPASLASIGGPILYGA